MSNLSILKTSIRTYESLYSLNDLHQASGNDPKHRPTFFIKNQQTQELIEELKCENSHILPVKVIRGTQGGTYACEELALSYAMWISPKFHLVVLRAFIAMHKGELQNQQQTLPLAPQPERTFTRTFNEQFVFQLSWLWYGHGRMGDLLGKLEPALRAIGSHYAPTVHSHSIEYRRQYQILKPFIAELLADYDIDTFNRHGLNAVLKELDKGIRPQLTRN